jgi:hypothetical protein
MFWKGIKWTRPWQTIFSQEVRSTTEYIDLLISIITWIRYCRFRGQEGRFFFACSIVDGIVLVLVVLVVVETLYDPIHTRKRNPVLPPIFGRYRYQQICWLCRLLRKGSDGPAGSATVKERNGEFVNSRADGPFTLRLHDSDNKFRKQYYILTNFIQYHFTAF